VSDPTPRDERGKWLEKPEAAMPYSITKDNASEMAKKRWAKFREAAADAVTERIKTVVPDATTPEAAWGVLNARLAVQIMKSEKPRGRDLDSLGQNIGAKPNAYERSDVENPSPGPDLASAAMQLAAILRDALSGREIIDSPAIDVPALDNDDNDTRNE
jgi:hypothetical protein